MIDVSLAYIRTVLNQYLSNRFGVNEDIVVLNGVVMPDGTPPQKNQNKVIVTLVDLEYETSRQFYGDQRLGTQYASQVSLPVCFNLHILVSASFDDYSEALKFLTASIGFFQSNTLLNRASDPLLPEGVSALKFEIENSPSRKMESIWTALGAKYMPSIIYKVRQVYVQSDQVDSTVALVRDVSGSAAP